MTHPDLGPELRALAQAILDRLDPSLRAAATLAAETLRGPGRCQQVWCPVCALAALAAGEQHPMLNLIAEHSVTLMAAVRAMVADPASGDTHQDSQGESDCAPRTAPGEPDQENGESGTGYQSIPIVIFGGAED